MTAPRLTRRGTRLLQALTAFLWSLAFLAGVFLPYTWVRR